MVCDFAATACGLLFDTDIINQDTTGFPQGGPGSAPIHPHDWDDCCILSELCDGLIFLDAHHCFVEGQCHGECRAAPAFLTLGMDKAPVDMCGHLSVEPLKFAFSFLKQHVHDHPSAWATLAHISNLSHLPKNFGREAKLSDWHFCAGTTLESLIKVQKAGGLHWNLPTGDSHFPS